MPHRAYDAVDARAVPFETAADALADVDLVISCTGAQGLVLTADAVATAAERRHRPLVFLDLALPRDIDPAVRDLSAPAWSTSRTCARPPPPVPEAAATAPPPSPWSAGSSRRRSPSSAPSAAPTR
nr:hypothetical protein [Nocardiopsis sp. CNR-923]